MAAQIVEMVSRIDSLVSQISRCDICRDRFAKSASNHAPRPVVWLSEKSRILIAGQAPGARVHASGKPFTDPSGDRLRDWMGIDETAFYDRDVISILPMAFCFPGYSPKNADLPPPPICARTWRQRTIEHLPNIQMTLLVGGYAQKWHLPNTASVTENVANWRNHAPSVFPLPHPSWRNTGWLKRHAWFEAELLPALQSTVKEILNG